MFWVACGLQAQDRRALNAFMPGTASQPSPSTADNEHSENLFYYLYRALHASKHMHEGRDGI